MSWSRVDSVFSMKKTNQRINIFFVTKGCIDMSVKYAAIYFMNAFFRFIKEIIKNYLNIKSRSY